MIEVNDDGGPRLLDKRITGGHVPGLPENREGPAPSSLHQLKTSCLLPGRRSSISRNLA